MATREKKQPMDDVQRRRMGLKPKKQFRVDPEWERSMGEASSTVVNDPQGNSQTKPVKRPASQAIKSPDSVRQVGLPTKAGEGKAQAAGIQKKPEANVFEKALAANTPIRTRQEAIEAYKNGVISAEDLRGWTGQQMTNEEGERRMDANMEVVKEYDRQEEKRKKLSEPLRQEYNRRIRSVREAMESGRFSKEEADEAFRQVEEWRSGVELTPQEEEAPEPSPEEIMSKRRWVDPDSGVEYTWDKNGVPQVLREPEQKSETQDTPQLSVRDRLDIRKTAAEMAAAESATGTPDPQRVRELYNEMIEDLTGGTTANNNGESAAGPGAEAPMQEGVQIAPEKITIENAQESLAPYMQDVVSRVRQAGFQIPEANQEEVRKQLEVLSDPESSPAHRSLALAIVKNQFRMFEKQLSQEAGQ